MHDQKSDVRHAEFAGRASAGPRSAQSWYEAGLASERAGDWQLAADAYGTAAKRDPDSARIFERLGLAHDHLAHRGRAREAFTRVLDLDPTTRPIDRELLAAKTNFFTFRRDQVRFVEAHLADIRAQTRAFLATPAPPRRSRTPIFVYWGQGFAQAPALVSRCRTELARWHDAQDIVELDDTTVGDWVDIPPHVERIRDSHRAHYSDYLRCALLQRHGGVWVDATVLTTAPIHDHLPAMSSSDMFVFRFGPESASISNWFMWAQPGGPMITTLAAALDVYWRHHMRPVHYFFFHHLFEALTLLDDDFRDGWARAWRHPGVDPRALLACMYAPWDEDRAALALIGSFVHKLAHKNKGDRFTPDQMLEVLTAHPETAWT